MAYTVLARRYRSQRFEDVAGQDAIARTLRNAITSDRVAHAYLFCGTRGVGKTTMARILAKALNCLRAAAPTTDPCCECESCLSINTGDDIDVIEIDGASNNGVDNIRDLRQNAMFRPARSRFKIYIIDEIHMLSTGAFNALLKILEEPPAHVKFIFATTEPNKVLPTIQSRCQRFDFRSIDPLTIAKQVKSVLAMEKVSCDDDFAMAVSRLANGSMRDALSLLDQLLSTGANPLTLEVLEEALGEPGMGQIVEMTSQIAASDAAGVLATADALLTRGMSAGQIIDSLVDYMRDLMIAAAAGVDNALIVQTARQREKTAEIVRQFDVASLVYAVTTLEKMRDSVKRSDNPRALLEAALIRLALSENFINIQSIAQVLSSGGVKKNAEPRLTSPRPRAAGGPAHSPRREQAPHVQVRQISCADTDELFARWGEITAQVGAAQPLLKWPLSDCAPLKFDGNVLEIASKSHIITGDMNQKADLVNAAFSEVLGKAVIVRVHTDSSVQVARAKGAKASSRQHDELLQADGVQEVISAFKAQVISVHPRAQ
jgi:DNA polymerase-3 subunit gamma/tau